MASPPQGQTEELELIKRILDGDDAAFQVIVDRHGRQLFAQAYRMLGNEQEAEDVVQETLISAFRQLKKFDGRSTLGTWLYRIVANRSIDVLRARKRRGTELDLMEGTEPIQAKDPNQEQLVHGRQIGQAVGRALDRLGPKERAAFVMRHYQGFNTAEIGEALGVGTSAAKHAVFRAVKKLKSVLSPGRTS